MKHFSNVTCGLLLALVCSVVAVAPASAGHVSNAFDDQMKPVVASYLAIQERLAADSLDGVSNAAATLASSASGLRVAEFTGHHAEHYKQLPAKVAEGAEALGNSSTIEEARNAFKVLSRPMAMWASMAKPAGVSVVYCSMANASWLQSKGDIRNPYYGVSMLACGEVAESSGSH